MNKNIFKELGTKTTNENVVYIMKFVLEDGSTLYKIGVTHYKREVERMLEILKSFFVKYRYTPMCKLMRFKRFTNAYSTEKILHQDLANYKFTFDKPFSGSTEFFTGLDEVDLIAKYDKIHLDHSKE